ncbi:site-specific integrase [Mycoplasmatota bacterium WC44]
MIIQEDVIKVILTYLAKKSDCIEIIRARVMIYILLDTGVRKNELRNIKLENLDLENNQINLKYTKTRVNRTVFVSDITKAAIINCIEAIGPNDYLLTTLDGKRQLSLKSMERVVNKIKKKLNLPDEISISFHKFRHTYATMYLSKGADLEFIRKTLGHKHLTTTEKYLHVSKEKLQEQHIKYSLMNSFQ